MLTYADLAHLTVPYLSKVSCHLRTLSSYQIYITYYQPYPTLLHADLAHSIVPYLLKVSCHSGTLSSYQMYITYYQPYPTLPYPMLTLLTLLYPIY